MAIRDEDVLPVCNFCEKGYDPYDRHTCQGNSISPRRKINVTTFGDSEPKFIPGMIYCEYCNESLPEGVVCTCEEWQEKHGLHGLTRQQIGEALDADRDIAATYAALDNQVGGDHYRQMKIQPVEFIIANGIGFLAGNVIKYAARYKAKGGAEDVRKIIHYCKLILEFEYGEKS